MEANSNVFVCALLAGDYPQSRLLIHEVFRSAGWRLYEAKARRQALDCLAQHPVHVVMARCDSLHWPWRSVLHDLRQMVRPPQLIVTTHATDAALWAEVLNRGGYDVLVEPFQREEVARVVAAARRHWDGTRARAASS